MNDAWLRPLLHATFVSAAPGLVACRMCDVVVEDAIFNGVEHYRARHGGGVVAITGLLCVVVVATGWRISRR